MRRRVTIRLGHSDNQEVSWAVSEGTGEEASVAVGRGSLADAASVAQSARVSVLVPAVDVTLLPANVPPSNRRRLIAAVPYTLEDQLIDDVDALHFAIGQRDASDLLATAVVARSQMQAWLDQLGAANIRVEALVPETLAVPPAANEWTLLVEDDKAILRTGEQTGLGIDPENISPVVSLALANAGEKRPAKMLVIDCRSNPDAPLFVSSDIDLDRAVPGEPAIGFMARELEQNQIINLLQQDYSQRERLEKLWRPWRPAAAMLAGLIFIQLVVAGVERHQLTAQLAALDQQTRDVFLAAFPNRKRVVDPEREMKQALAQLKGGGGGGQSDFLGLLVSTGEQFSTAPTLQLDRLSYRAGQINASFTIQDLQSLDQLKQRLTDKGGLAIDIQSATSREGKVEARLQIERKGS